MLIKKISRLLTTCWRLNKDIEVLFRFHIDGTYLYFYALRLKRYINKTYIVSEFNEKIPEEKRRVIRDFIRSDNRFRGRGTIIIC